MDNIWWHWGNEKPYKIIGVKLEGKRAFERPRYGGRYRNLNFELAV
jgi:hypothetical protein